MKEISEQLLELCNTSNIIFNYENGDYSYFLLGWFFGTIITCSGMIAFNQIAEREQRNLGVSYTCTYHIDKKNQ